MELQKFCKKLVEKSKCNNFEAMEVYGIRALEQEVGISEKKIVVYHSALRQGIHIKGKYMGNEVSYYTEILDEKMLDVIIHELQKSVTEKKQISTSPMCVSGLKYKQMNDFSEELDELTNAEKKEILYKVEEAILAEKNSDLQYEYCGLVIMDEENVLENSNGVSLKERNNIGMVTCNIVLKKDEEVEKIFNVLGFKKVENITPYNFGRCSMKQAVSGLVKTSISSGKYSIILENNAVTQLLSFFMVCFNAEKVISGIERLKGKIGEQIFSTLITIVDDPYHGFNKKTFDGEGMPTKKNILVNKGILVTFMHNLESAQRWKTESTGNAIRDIEGNVGIGINNLYISPGVTSRQEMLLQMNEGILITEISDVFSGSDLNSGDFACPCKGIKVDSGKLSVPIKEIILRGNFFEMMKNVTMVGNDLEINLKEGFYGSPSICVGELQIESMQ